MAGKTIKTPVMVLTELTVKKGIPPPEFILISAINNTHDNEFTYQVVVEGVSAIGMGKSKKEAKQNTAHLALELLNRKGIYHPDFGEVSDPELREKEIPSPKKPPVNCIGSLYDVCLEYKIPEPEYLEISDVGPPHCREFTYDCRICSLRTRATAHTKKQAKQQAAQAMLDKIIDVIPGIAEEFQTHLKALDNRDCEVIRNYTQLSNFNVRPNYSVKVGDFSTSLTNILKLKDIDTESLKHFKDREPSPELLKEILETFDLKYAMEKLQDDPATYILNVSLDTPFSVFGVGHIEEAEKVAAKKAIEIIYRWLGC